MKEKKAAKALAELIKRVEKLEEPKKAPVEIPSRLGRKPTGCGRSGEHGDDRR